MTGVELIAAERKDKQWFSCTKVFDEIFWMGFGVAKWAIGFNVGPYLIIFGQHNKPIMK